MKQTLFDEILHQLREVRFINSTPDCEWYSTSSDEDGIWVTINQDKSDYVIYIEYDGVFISDADAIRITDYNSYVVDKYNNILVEIDTSKKIVSLGLFNNTGSDVANIILSMKLIDIPSYLSYEINPEVVVDETFPKFEIKVNTDSGCDTASADVYMRSGIDDIIPLHVLSYKDFDDLSLVLSQMYTDIRSISGNIQTAALSMVRYMLVRRRDHDVSIYEATKSEEYMYLEDVETGDIDTMTYGTIFDNTDCIMLMPRGTILAKLDTDVESDPIKIICDEYLIDDAAINRTYFEEAIKAVSLLINNNINKIACNDIESIEFTQKEADYILYLNNLGYDDNIEYDKIFLIIEDIIFGVDTVVSALTRFIHEDDYIREDVDDVDAVIKEAIDAAVEDLKDDIEHTAKDIDNLPDNDEH